MTPDLVISLIYLLLVICIIYPSIEFVSAGLTIQNVFSSILGNESEDFILYHIKRTTLTLFVYSVLPLGYVSLIHILGEEDGLKTLWISDNLACYLFVTSAKILPLLAFSQIYLYGFPTWENHPIVLNIKQFCNAAENNWQTVARSINLEFRSIDKVSIQTNSITKLLATENWVFKISPLGLAIVHQSDASFVVQQSDTHPFSHLNTGETQFITIDIRSQRGPDFKVRLNALDFRDLQDRISRVITVLPQVRFHKNLVDKFLDAFKEAIEGNPRHRSNEELDQCIGCMQNVANVKIQQLCEVTTPNPCQECRCKPMWCVDCMGRWFAHRQDPEKVDRWLSEKCSCPICRSTFCLLDVSYVETATN